MVRMGEAIEEEERVKAKGRIIEGAKKGYDNLSEPNEEAGSTRDIVANLLGTSGKTYVKAKEVVKAAEEDPDKFDY
jgi:hypothetical protein